MDAQTRAQSIDRQGVKLGALLLLFMPRIPRAEVERTLGHVLYI